MYITQEWNLLPAPSNMACSQLAAHTQLSTIWPRHQHKIVVAHPKRRPLRTTPHAVPTPYLPPNLAEQACSHHSCPVPSMPPAPHYSPYQNRPASLIPRVVSQARYPCALSHPLAEENVRVWHPKHSKILALPNLQSIEQQPPDGLGLASSAESTPYKSTPYTPFPSSFFVLLVSFSSLSSLACSFA